MTLHGPHHVVAKSTTTSLSVSCTILSNASSEPISTIAPSRARESRAREIDRPATVGAGVQAAAPAKSVAVRASFMVLAAANSTPRAGSVASHPATLHTAA